MLIHLSNNLKDSLFGTGKIEESALVALQNIAQARAQGDHIISGDKGIIDYIINCTELSQNTIGVFRKISGEQSQFGRLRFRLKTYVLVDSLSGPKSIEETNLQRIIKLPLARFKRNDITQPTALVGENLMDCELLIRYSSWFSEKYSNGIFPSKLKATLFPGGGDTTDRVIKYLVDSQRYFALGITDSDQTYPRGGKGQTTQKCSAIQYSEISYHKRLPVKSIENLFSLNQIEQILDIDHTRHIWKLNLSRLNPISKTESWKYFPFKTGVAETVGPFELNTSTFYWRSASTNLANHGKDSFIFPPISSKLLQWGVEHFLANDPICIKNEDFLFEVWEDISQLISSWTCTTDPIRA